MRLMMRTAYGAGSAAGGVVFVVGLIALVPLIAVWIGIVIALEATGMDSDAAFWASVGILAALGAILLVLTRAIDKRVHIRRGHVRCPVCLAWFYPGDSSPTNPSYTWYRDMHLRRVHPLANRWREQ